MLGDWPETGGRIDTTTHSDVDENIFTLERDFPEKFSPVREVNQLVVKTGELNKVKTYIVPPPLICKLPSSLRLTPFEKQPLKLY